MLLLIGGASVWAQEAWLFPSLASALFAQALMPDQPSSRPYPVFVSQVLGATAGTVAVLAAGAVGLPAFSTAHPLLPARALAAGIAGLLAGAMLVPAKAINPAGGATAIVVALGLETVTWSGAGRLLTGIVLVTLAGEAVRQIVVRLR